MSQEQTIIIKNNNKLATTLKVDRKPIVVKKENHIKLHGESSNQLLKNLKLGGPLYTESLIFQSVPGEFVGNSPVKVSIVNRFDLLKKNTRTIITYYDQLNGKELSVKTSDPIARFIGPSNYQTVINAICTISEEKTKVNAIMALLTNELVEESSTPTINEEPHFQPNIKEIKSETSVEEKCCQTDESCMDLILKLKQKKRVKRAVLTPYVIKDTPKKVIKKCVININTKNRKQNCPDVGESSQTATVNKFEYVNVEAASSRIPELQLSDSESVSNLTLSGSICGDEFLQPEPYFKSIDLHTVSEDTIVTVMNSDKHYINLPTGVQIEVSVKPEFPFHMATPDILKTLNNEDKVKLVSYQAFLDFKWCLERDSDGYLPIHDAVMNNDVDLLRRQCVVLRYRQQSLDITAGNNLTALQISMYYDTPQCTALLIQYGADPLLTDEEHRTCLHLAAESSLDNLRAVIKNCENSAREILQDHPELWKPEYESKSKEELAAILLNHMCRLHDSDGYTPLMISAKSGNYGGVKALLAACPDGVNQPVPINGCTALFLAVEGACHDAANRSNKSKLADNFYQTISILLQNGADNNVTNHSGTTISDLLADNGNAELSTLLANMATSNKFFSNNMPKKFDNYILIKKEEGEIIVEEIKPKKYYDISNKEPLKSIMKKEDDVLEANKTKIADEMCIKKEKPIILENITIAPSPNKVYKDPNTINAIPKIKINPKDMLITNKKKSIIEVTTQQNVMLKPFPPVVKILPKKCSQPNLKKLITQQNIMLKPTPPVVKLLPKTCSQANLKKEVNAQQNEALKRKSINEPGPSTKKTKDHKTT